MDKLKVHVVGHTDRIQIITDLPFIKKVNLSKLDIGKYQDNQLAESRIFVSDAIEQAEYVGVLSYNYRTKWPQLVPWNSLIDLPFRPDLLYCAEIPAPRWDDWFMLSCPGMEPLFRDMVQYSGFCSRNFPTLMANAFISSWEVFSEFLFHWRRIFYYLYEKYPPASMTFQSFDDNRRAGYLYEALSALVWAHLIKERNLTLSKLSMDSKRKFSKRILVPITKG